jgi:hypothetical protein
VTEPAERPSSTQLPNIYCCKYDREATSPHYCFMVPMPTFKKPTCPCVISHAPVDFLDFGNVAINVATPKFETWGQGIEHASFHRDVAMGVERDAPISMVIFCINPLTTY